MTHPVAPPVQPSPHQAAGTLWAALGGEPDDLHHLRIRGEDPFYASPFRVGTAAAASVGVAALAAARLWHARTGRWQDASVDLRHAAVAFRSERYLRIDGATPASPWDALAGYYRDRAGRHIQLHTNFEHHRERALGVLGAAPDRAAVAAAVAERDAFELEEALTAAGACGFAMRSREEWLAHPQGRAVGGLPVAGIEALGTADPEPLPDGDAPLAGVRVLDLTRVIAGPVCGRTLAALGADVLRVGADHLPTIDTLVVDTGMGKRFAHLDLRGEPGREHLRTLMREADVVVQAFRPGALEPLGFGVDEIARMRPGIVQVSLCAWSHAGPWASRRGYDSLVQTASGIAHEGGARAGVDDPRPLPAQALDHASGYLAAAAAMLGLLRRATAGGGSLARISLAQTGAWIDGLGRAPADAGHDPSLEDVADLIDEMPSARGRLAFVRPAFDLSETTPAWRRPPSMPGADRAEWGR